MLTAATPWPMSLHSSHKLRCIYAGTSSFGMSGINAHALVRPLDAPPAVLGHPGLAWQQQVCRLGPAPHPFLSSWVEEGAFAMRLVQPGLAAIWDHCVDGRALLPAAAMLEASWAAVASLTGSSAGQLLGRAAFSAPLPLTSGSAQEVYLRLSPSLESMVLEPRRHQPCFSVEVTTARPWQGPGVEHVRMTTRGLAPRGWSRELVPSVSLPPASSPASVGFFSEASGTATEILSAHIDAMFHLGAVPVGGASAAALHVPTQVQGFALPTKDAGGRLVGHCCVRSTPCSPARGSITSCGGAQFGPEGAGMAVEGLTARPLRRGSDTPGSAGPATSKTGPEDVLYQMDWLASNASTMTHPDTALQSRAVPPTSISARSWVVNLVEPAAARSAAAASLQLLQCLRMKGADRIHGKKAGASEAFGTGCAGFLLGQVACMLHAGDGTAHP